MSNYKPEFPPLYTQDPLDRFSDRANDYAKYRPSYPGAAIDAILAGLGQPSDLIVADIGAGTGISSRLMADRGAMVWAIEPNATMRDAAESHSRVEFWNGTAEQTGLPDHSVGLVLCCQSFHWFEPVATLTEFHRILRPQGRVALMWNERNRDDQFTEQYTSIIRKAADPAYFERIERRASEGSVLQHSPLFQTYRCQVFVNSHRLDRAGLIGIASSASYIPQSGPAYEQLILDLQQLYDRWLQDFGAEAIQLSYHTHLYLADVVPQVSD